MSEHFVSRLLFMLAGLIIWAVHFGFVYGFNALACTFGFAGSQLLGMGVVVLAVGLATFLAFGADILVMLRAVAGPHAVDLTADSRRFMRYVAGSLAALSAVSVLWQGLPALMVPACG